MDLQSPILNKWRIQLQTLSEISDESMYLLPTQVSPEIPSVSLNGINLIGNQNGYSEADIGAKARWISQKKSVNGKDNSNLYQSLIHWYYHPVDGVVFCANYAGEDQRQGSGNLIITSSTSAHIVNVPTDQPVHNENKAFITYFGKSVAREWREFARINIVSPGFFDTKMGASPLAVNEAYRMTCLERQGHTKKLSLYTSTLPAALPHIWPGATCLSMVDIPFHENMFTDRLNRKLGSLGMLYTLHQWACAISSVSWQKNFGFHLVLWESQGCYHNRLIIWYIEPSRRPLGLDPMSQVINRTSEGSVTLVNLKGDQSFHVGLTDRELIRPISYKTFDICSAL